jgi:NAD+ kinase
MPSIETTFQTIAVICKRDARIRPTLEKLIDHLRARGRAIVADAGSAQMLPDRLRAASAEELRACDLAIVIGGDGTLLNAGRLLASHGVPILGINQGRLGFMVDVPPDDLEPAVDEVLDNRFVLENRLLMSVTLTHAGAPRRSVVAVNDVVIRNQTAIRMLEFETFRGEHFISSHRADGIIIATPTGSTAYALSGGGPIVHPALDAFAMVPICPHALADRPLVVPADQAITIKLGGVTEVRALCTTDGQINESMVHGDSVEVRASPQRLKLLHPASYNYFSILRNKLQWGRDRV